MYSNVKKHYNILCIDDNENNLFTLSALLKQIDNLNPIIANSADKGLKIVLKEQIDLILLDVQMPVMNGFEAARLLKKNKQTRDIPIIFITAVFKSEEFIREGFDLGAVDYLTKPIDDKQLLNKITLYLRIFEKTYLLQQSEKKFYTITQSIGDGIYTLDLNNRVTFINKAALDMLGFTKKELLNKEIHDFIHYKNKANQAIHKDECKIHHALQEVKKYTTDDECFIRKDGTFLPVEIMVTPLIEDHHEVVGTLVVFRDKTNQNRITKLETEKITHQEQIIHSMIGMIESRDSYTAGHTKRVAKYCEMIAKGMDFSEDQIELLKRAAWLHDIGKISTPDNILLKPTRLTTLEYELIQEHLLTGYEMLKEIDAYKDIADIMVQHHERYDGTGYPYGLKGDEISPLGRIMIVADAFDAMTTNRVYKPKKSVQKALDELAVLSMKQFHPEVVNVALEVLRDIKIDDTITQLPKSKIEEQRFSYFYRDKLTNLLSLEYLQLALLYHQFPKNPSLYTLKLHNFSLFNKKEGWANGNKLLVSFSQYLEEIYPQSLIFRVEGDDFLLLNKEPLEGMQERLNKSSVLEETAVYVTVEEELYIAEERLEELIHIYL